MRKKLLTVLLIAICSYSFGQVGINTSSPRATLEVAALSNPPSGVVNGIIIPTVTTLPSTGVVGLLIYLDSNDSSEGFYLHDGTSFGILGTTGAKEVVRASFSSDTGINNGSQGANSRFVSWNKISFNSETTSTTSYNEGTGIYTAPADGLYEVSAFIQSTFTVGDNEDHYGIAIYVNGTRRAISASINSRFVEIRRAVSQTIYLSQNDTVEIYIGFPETFGNFNNIESDTSYLNIRQL